MFFLDTERDCRGPVHQDVDHQNLRGRERQSLGPEKQGCEHQQGNRCDVGRHLIADKVANVLVDLPSFFHGVDNVGKVIVLQHHVSGILGNVRASDAHGNANVGARKRRGIVDTVPRHGDDFPLFLQRGNDSHLLVGCHAGVNGDFP